jgi:hypothetical protein
MGSMTAWSHEVHDLNIRTYLAAFAYFFHVIFGADISLTSASHLENFPKAGIWGK